MTILRQFFTNRLGEDFPDIHLLDIGASGGIDTIFHSFGENLTAVGVDPLVAEVDRLNRITDNPKIRYLDALIAWKEWESHYPLQERRGFSTHPFRRLSSAAAIANSGLDYKKEHHNADKEVVYSDRTMELDDLVSQFPDQRIDFLKTDTDGFDFPVLKSGQQMLAGRNVLMAKVEANLHGNTHDYANNFANIDRYMRGMGLSLLDLQTYRYSRSALPDQFCYSIPAQTVSGQILWGDAVYYRDFCNPAFAETFDWTPNSKEVIRLLCLLELFGFHDVSVELLIDKRDLLGLNDGEIREPLDMIVRKERGQYADSYDALTDRFKTDYRTFYPE